MEDEDKPGMKFDEGKLRWDLVPWAAFREVVKVITYGANKYSENNWKKVEKKRYVAALFRHMDSYLDPDQSDLDGETCFHHLAHATCNLIFLLWAEFNLNKG